MRELDVVVVGAGFGGYLGFPRYKKKCDDVAAKGYEGLELRA